MRPISALSRLRARAVGRAAMCASIVSRALSSPARYRPAAAERRRHATTVGPPTPPRRRVCRRQHRKHTRRTHTRSTHADEQRELRQRIPPHLNTLSSPDRRGASLSRCCRCRCRCGPSTDSLNSSQPRNKSLSTSRISCCRSYTHAHLPSLPGCCPRRRLLRAPCR